MSIRYEVYGPFEIPRGARGLFSRDHQDKKAFWQRVNQGNEGLSDACGCYVISVRNRVWYVGKARQQGFSSECFAPHKITKIDEAIFEGKGKAYLHLVARQTPTGRFCRPSDYFEDIDKLELMLIAFALERNGELLNKKYTKVLREIVVPGIFNSPQGSGRANAVQSLKKILDI